MPSTSMMVSGVVPPLAKNLMDFYYINFTLQGTSINARQHRHHPVFAKPLQKRHVTRVGTKRSKEPEFALESKNRLLYDCFLDGYVMDASGRIVKPRSSKGHWVKIPARRCPRSSRSCCLQNVWDTHVQSHAEVM